MMFLLVALDLCFFVRGFSSCSELGLLFIVVLGLLIVVVSLLWSTGFSRLDPVVAPCGIFLEQGIKLVSTTLSGGFLAIASPGKPQAIKLRNGIGFLGLILFYLFISSVQFCRSVVSDSLQPHGLQHARHPCPSPTPRACSYSCPLSRWCHPTISSCHPLLLLPSNFPSIRIFSSESVLPLRWPNNWSFCFSISPSNEYSGLISFRMDWFDLLAAQGTLSRDFSNTTVQKH